MGLFGKVKEGLKKASDNAKDEVDLDEGVDVGAVVDVVNTLRKKKQQQ